MHGLRKLRVACQIVFFALFALSFFLTARLPVAYSFPSEWFLWLNPLSGVLASVASREVLAPALVVSLLFLAVTIVFGRVFCGFVCPLGASIDFCDRYLFRRMRHSGRRPLRHLHRLKYVLLCCFIVAAAFGVLFPLFFDPILLFTRIFVLVVHPLSRVLAVDAQQIVRPLLDAVGIDRLSLLVITVPLYYGIAGALLLFALVLGGGYWDRRFWCQYVCPSGAFLGLIGRYAPFHRRVRRGQCNECRVCSRNTCPTRAFGEPDYTVTSIAECVVCGNCAANTKQCTEFGFFSFDPKTCAAADLSRRHVVAGGLGGLLLLPLLRANALSRRDETGRLIRPPGAVPEKDFAARCLACGQCMKACPTNAIQPCTSGDGVHRLYTPKIVPRVGGCEEKCYLCGHVCPTNALRALPYEEKRFVKIGTAVIDRHRCLAWEQNKECVVCDEVCPYNAITTTYVQTTTGWFKAPIVNEDLCIGCGLCENHCPIADQAAIVVYKFGENRLLVGPYVSDSKRQEIIEKRRKSDAGAMGGSFESAAASPDSLSGRPVVHDGYPTEGGGGQGGLPPGFTLD